MLTPHTLLVSLLLAMSTKTLPPTLAQTFACRSTRLMLVFGGRALQYICVRHRIEIIEAVIL